MADDTFFEIQPLPEWYLRTMVTVFIVAPNALALTCMPVPVCPYRIRGHYGIETLEVSG